jgi:NAD-dependent dihydropyrimidine dehydrogenase PreA subunit
MRIQVNQEKCSGCGTCVETCHVNAVNLDSGKAAIDQVVCTRCEACINVCPLGAICLEAEPVQVIPAIEHPAAHALLVPLNEAPRTLAPWAGIALAFLGREIMPRLADVLVTALERRLAPSVTSVKTEWRPAPANESRSHRHRQRRRGNVL